MNQQLKLGTIAGGGDSPSTCILEVQPDRHHPVVLSMSRRDASILHQLVGMLGGVTRSGLYEVLHEAFDPEHEYGAAEFRAEAQRYKFHQPFVNHCGVIVINPPSPARTLDHNKPHFPCSERGRR